jgi:hypothetical protein
VVTGILMPDQPPLDSYLHKPISGTGWQLQSERNEQAWNGTRSKSQPPPDQQAALHHPAGFWQCSRSAHSTSEHFKSTRFVSGP